MHIRQYAKRTNKILSFLTTKSKVQVYNTTQFYQRAKYLSPTELHLNLRTSLSLSLWYRRWRRFVGESERPRIRKTITMEGDKYLQEFLVETSMFNSIVLGHLLPSNWWVTLPHFLQTWLRNYIAGTLLYFISGFLWCFYIYYLKRNVYVPKGRTHFFILCFSWFEIDSVRFLNFFNLGFFCWLLGS